MTKKYTSRSCVSVNAVLPNGKHLHIAFSALTEGGSVYYTDSEDVQKALESHRYYGSYYKAEEVAEEPANEAAEPAEEPAEEPANVVKVSSLDEAKDYLSEKFGISRTKLKGVAGTKAVAEQHGIILEGI